MDNRSVESAPFNSTSLPVNIPSHYGPTDENYDVIREMAFYAMMVVIPLGLVCNALALCVFLTSRSLRITTTGRYLLALTLTDFLFLASDLLRVLNSYDARTATRTIIGVTFVNDYDVICKAVHYARYAFKLASAWLTVVITTERLIVIAWPLHVGRISTVASTNVVIILLYAACLGVGAYPVWTVGARGSPGLCRITDGETYELWSMVVLRCGSLFVPGVLMCVLTAVIISCLAMARARRKGLLGTHHHPRGDSTTTRAAGPGLKKSCGGDCGEATIPPPLPPGVRTITTTTTQGQLSAMLVAVAVAFIVLRLPNTVAWYYNQYKEEIWVPLDPWHSFAIYVIYRVCDIIATTNYVINFFLYCLCGSAFRARVRGLYSCGRAVGGRDSGGSARRSATQSPRPPYHSGRSSQSRPTQLTAGFKGERDSADSMDSGNGSSQDNSFCTHI